MSLDRGGQCRGVVFRLAPDNLGGQLGKLVRREMTVKPPNNLPRWIAVETAQGPLRAVAFVMNRASRFYTGRLPPEQVADVLATACGHWAPAPSTSTTPSRTCTSTASATATSGTCKPWWPSGSRLDPLTWRRLHWAFGTAAPAGTVQPPRCNPAHLSGSWSCPWCGGNGRR
ncbi:gamma-glutamylcyclotransferase [Microvirga sp. G4-2]|uniref:gamma-glutamylcyclotransferase n=1 Tax=Microvirga sp. G4-2 TaxID=3434467 RepID=UPI004044DD51